MTERDPDYIDNPSSVNQAHIDAILAKGSEPTIQFSKAGQDKGLLRAVNALAAHYGDRLHVRFYGHYSDVFDAAILAHLPDVQWLSVDRLTDIRNEGAIGEMPKLKKLSFGVFRFADDAFLKSLPLARLSELAVWENERGTLDLEPLARAPAIERLIVSGHTKGIAAIASLPRLAQLELWRVPRTQRLDVLQQAPVLRELKLVLGGRSSFDEFSHPGIEALTASYVKGLSSIGSLNRFPGLRTLDISQQGLLRTIDLRGVSLEKLVTMDCKSLEEITGLTLQQQLRELRIARTAVPLDPLLQQPWPPSLSVVGLYNKSQRWNAQARTTLDARGYTEYARR